MKLIDSNSIFYPSDKWTLIPHIPSQITGYFIPYLPFDTKIDKHTHISPVQSKQHS